jgi:hypothetical protein
LSTCGFKSEGSGCEVGQCFGVDSLGSEQGCERARGTDANELSDYLSPEGEADDAAAEPVGGVHLNGDGLRLAVGGEGESARAVRRIAGPGPTGATNG